MAKLQHRIQPASSLLSNARSSPIAVVVISYRTPPLLQRFCPHRGAFPWYAALVGRRGLAVVVCVCAPEICRLIYRCHRYRYYWSPIGFQQVSSSRLSRDPAEMHRAHATGSCFFRKAVRPFRPTTGRPTWPRVKPTMKLLMIQKPRRWKKEPRRESSHRLMCEKRGSGAL